MNIALFSRPGSIKEDSMVIPDPELPGKQKGFGRCFTMNVFCPFLFILNGLVHGVNFNRY
jgi:hypothetical protein